MPRLRCVGAVLLAALLTLAPGCVSEKLRKEGRPPFSKRTTVLEDAAIAVETTAVLVGGGILLLAGPVALALWAPETE